MQVLTVDFTAPNAAEQFSRSLKNTGFAVLTNHPIAQAEVSAVYEEWQRFFDDPARYEYSFDKEHQDGYFPSEIAETAKGHQVKDLKEFYHFYPWGRQPKMLSQATATLYQRMSEFAFTLLQWIEAYTPADIAQSFSMPLSDMAVNSPQTLLRILRYPPLPANLPLNAVRAAPHEDINLITVLPAATDMGLQVRDLAGNWHNVSCDHGSISVNIGDMLQECSQGYYPSTTHRVTNPTGEAALRSRLSMPLFLHARPEVRISDRYLAGEYLQERLRELGLK